MAQRPLVPSGRSPASLPRTLGVHSAQNVHALHHLYIPTDLVLALHAAASHDSCDHSWVWAAECSCASLQAPQACSDCSAGFARPWLGQQQGCSQKSMPAFQSTRQKITSAIGLQESQGRLRAADPGSLLPVWGCCSRSHRAATQWHGSWL